MLNGLDGFICSDCVEMAHQVVRENLKAGRDKSEAYDTDKPLMRPAEIRLSWTSMLLVRMRLRWHCL